MRQFFHQDSCVATKHQPIKTAVIGTGYLGKYHAQKYADLDESELVGVCDLNSIRGKEIADKLKVPYYADYHQILDKVSAVSIATTTSSHYSIARDCLNHGIHVLVEKPITTTLEEANELIDIAATKKLTLQVGHLQRYNDAFTTVKPWLNQPRYISCNRLSPFQPRCTDVNVILDLMIHDIDLVQSMVDSEIINIQASGAKVLTPFIDLANARLEFNNGCVANVTASRIHHRPQRFMHISQQSGYLDIDFHHERIYINNLETKNPTLEPKINHTKIRIKKVDALLTQIKNFLHNINHQEKPLVDGAVGRDALATALAITETINERNRNYPLHSKKVAYEEQK